MITLTAGRKALWRRRYGVVAAPALVVAMTALLSPTAVAGPLHTGVSPLGWPNGGAQIAEMTSPDGGTGVVFGAGVAVSADGQTAVVGEPGLDDYTGAVYVYTNEDGTWTQTAELTASDGASDDAFGDAVAISRKGTTILVGAPVHTDPDSRAGAAYVFTLSDGTWTQTGELTSADGADYDYVGGSLALSAKGTTAVVGAFGRGNQTGAAYVFTDTDGTWSQTAELTASDGTYYETFGYSVAVSRTGTTAVIGAPQHANGMGGVYVFDDDGGAWSQSAELSASDGAAFAQFGNSVAVSSRGTTVAVGSPGYGTDLQGAMYVFADSDGTWTQTAEASSSTDFDGLGTSIALSAKGSTVIAGAPSNLNGAGSAYVYAGKHGVAWTQRAHLTPGDGSVNDQFGYDVGLSGNGATALVGSPEPDAAGAAYVFER